MKNNPKTNFGHGVANTDDISIGISDDGERYVIRHAPSGETVELGADGVSAGAIQSQELSVSDVLDAPNYPTQADLPADRPVGFIALIEDENRIYFEGA